MAPAGKGSEMLVKADAGVRKQMLDQIGRMNLLAISGGRVKPIEHGVELPVGSGYSVRVELNALDYYEVSRVYRRGGKEWVKGHRSDVDCFQLSEVAYYASCFRSYDEGEWPRKAA